MSPQVQLPPVDPPASVVSEHRPNQTAAAAKLLARSHTVMLQSKKSASLFALIMFTGGQRSVEAHH